MSTWLYSVGAVTGISLISLLGAAALAMREQVFRRVVLVLVSFAAGALFGDVFFHLLPELSEEKGLTPRWSLLILIGLGSFFVLEKLLHWHHAHIASEEVLHPVAVTNLVGDGLHNFVDGAIIAGAFLQSTSLGVATAVAVAFHEIPQELGDVAILVHAGMGRRRALVTNFLTALAAIAGAISAMAVGEVIDSAGPVLTAFTIGGFVYIAGSDLIPELHRETRLGTSFIQLAAMSTGVGVMALLLLLD